jgi:hypothetical protein
MKAFYQDPFCPLCDECAESLHAYVKQFKGQKLNSVLIKWAAGRALEALAHEIIKLCEDEVDSYEEIVENVYAVAKMYQQSKPPR